jgi:hypothetical protein
MFLNISSQNEYQRLKSAVIEKGGTMASGGSAVDEYTWASDL